MARHERETERCPHHGGPRSECGDPRKPWYPQRTVCYATMAASSAQATYQRLHEDSQWHDGTFSEWSKVPSALFPYHRDAGVTIWVAPVDLTPDDDFLTATAPPWGAEGD